MKKAMAIAAACALTLCICGCSSEDPTQPVTLGETISTEGFNLTLDEATWEEPNEKGQWVYYEEKTSTGSYSSSVSRSVSGLDGKVLYVVKGTMENLGSHEVNRSGFYGEALFNGEYQYDVRVQPITGDEAILPLETAELYLYVELPEAMKDQYQNASIKFAFSDVPGEPLKSLDGATTVYELYFE